MSDERGETGIHDDLIDDLDPGAAAEADDEFPESFPNRLAAWEYLRDEGWQIGRAQFYEHCREGRLPRRPDGTYLRRHVDKYASHHCRRVETGERVNDTLSRKAEEKARVELEREKVRLERDRHDLDVRRGKYLPTDEVEQMLVGRAVALRAHLKAMSRMKAADWIDLVGGDQERARELIGAVDAAVEEHLAVYARDVEFEVLLEKNVEAEKPEKPEQEAT